MAIDSFANLRKNIQKQEESLSSSPSYYSSGLSPSQSDLDKESNLRSLKKQLTLGQAKKAADEWYDDTEDRSKEKPREGFIDKVVDTMNTPLYAGLGAIQHITGKGKGDNIIESMNKSIQGKDTFGDYLVSVGVPSSLAGPLGFALDLGVSSVLDPVALLGSGARYGSSLWRLGTGAKKAGLSGVKAAAKSSVLEKAATATRFVPGLRKTATGQKVFKAAKEATEGFEKKIGETFADYMDKPFRSSWYGPGVRDEMEKTFKQYAPKGEWIWDNFVGSGAENWYKRQEMREALINAGVIQQGKVVEGFEGVLEQSAGKFGKAAREANVMPSPNAENMEIGARAIERASEAGKRMGEELPPVSSAVAIVDDVPEMYKAPVARIRGEVDEANDLLRSGRNVTEANTSEGVIERFLEESQNEVSLADVYKYINEQQLTGETGFAAWDKLRKGMREWKPKEGSTLAKIPKIKDRQVFKDTLDFYEKYIGLFRIGKVFSNPASFTYAIMGNPVMAGMEGINILGRNYFKRQKEALKLLLGKAPTEVLDNFLANPKIGDWARENPRLFSKIFGFNHSSLSAQKVFRDMENSEEMMKLFAKIKDKDKFADELNRLAKAVKDESTNNQIKEALEKAVTSGKMRPDSELNEFDNFVVDFYKQTGRAPSPDDVPISFASNVLDYGAMQKWTNDLKVKADAGSVPAKALHWYLTKPADAYNLTDQTARLGLFNQLVMDGVSAGEVEKLRRFYSIDMNDLEETWDQGQRMLKFTPNKAAEISAGIYMNYAAMPAAIKALRSVPVLGSPFASFSYAMLGKTARTLAFNPTYFSKMNLGLKEASLALAGPQTPMEKAALEGNQSYLDSPWMLRLSGLPFFADHPVYLNLQNATPFLSNILAPNERTWSDTFKGDVGAMLDRAPVMKDPVGSLIMAHLVLPFLLEDGQQPQNFFGGQLYPKSATGLQKVGYAARDLAESVTPGFAGALAIPAHMIGGDALKSPEVIEKVPSYRYRSLMRAMQGLSASGTGSAKSIESPTEKQARAIFSMAGLNLNPINLTKKKQQ